MFVSTVEAPDYTSFPVSLADLATHIGTDDSTLGLLDQKRRAAIEHVADVTGRALAPQTVAVYLDEFPADGSPIKLPLPPLADVVTFRWRSEAGVWTTLTVGTDYLVDAVREPGRVVLPPNISWPSSTLYPLNPIEITIECGYDDGEIGYVDRPIPAKIKSAIHLYAAHLFANREAVITGDSGISTESKPLAMAMDALLGRYVVDRFGLIWDQK